MIGGAATIADLFATMFRLACYGLDGADVATLLRTTPGDVGSLGWASPALRSTLFAHVDALALRDPVDRLRLRKPERDRLIDALGGPVALGSARSAFLVAYAIDERYASISPRTTNGGSKAAIEAPPAFLGETTNAPPPLGQMTPQAACRRWMHAFWYVGDTRKLDVFGPLPTLRPRKLPSRAHEALLGALNDGELRVAIASWKRHTPGDLAYLPAAPGCFAVGGLTTEPALEDVEAVLGAARASNPHLVVFPELAFSEIGFERLLATLKAKRKRFPALLVVGRAHRRRASGVFENVGVVLDAGGGVVLEHEKMEPFSRPDGALEDIIPRNSDDYEYVDTPVGRLVVNICRDLRSDVPMLMNRTLGATLLMVPAYSRHLDFILEEARVLGARQHAVVASANASASSCEDCAAFYVAIRGKSSAILREANGKADGTVHAFRVSLGSGGIARFDGYPPVAV